MKRYLLTLFILISCFTHAQTIIKGIVLTGDNKPVPDINVTLQEKGRSLMLGYVLTDDAGKYKIEYKGKSDSIVVIVSGFNVGKQSKTVGNRSQDVNFSIVQESIVLKEVKIKPPKIRQAGDTLNYMVESFSDGNDRTIGDVLKKMPGIQVKDDGAILYQDRPINKFYIENVDLLQGRYGIATNNIEAKDVSTVQVMENHQPVKALKDREFSEDAAINLKLKDSAKGTLIANAQAGMGAAPLLWNNELTGMYIAKKLQNITTYKGNNSGDDPGRELNSFYSGDASRMKSNGLLNVQTPSSPSISEKRYLDNQANMVSFNNLWSLKTDYQLTANINYLNDYQQRSSYAYTENYLPNDETIKIEELLNSRLRKEKLGTDIQLNANKDKYYFNNLLKLEGVWHRERGDAISQDSVYQHLKKPDYGISNTFNLVKTNGKHTWTFYSFNGYNASSQTLRVQPVLYGQLFDPAPSPEAMVQDAERNDFASYSRITWGLGKGAVKQNYTLGFNTDLQQLKSALQADTKSGLGSLSDSLRNDIKQGKFEWKFLPNYTYSKGYKLNVSLSLPLSYTILDTDNNVSDKKENKGYLFFNPFLFASYKLSAYWDSYLNAGYSNSTGSLNNMYTGYIMSSYRNLLRNDGKLFRQQSRNYSLVLNYRNPITTLFGMASISYYRNKVNLLYDYYYSGILKLQSTIDMPNTASGINASVHGSKEIEAINTTVFIGGSYNNSRSAQINQGELIDYSNQSFSVSPRFLTKFGSSISFEYSIRYTQSQGKIKDSGRNFDPIRTTSQNAQLNIFPLKGLVINLRYENFYNNTITSGSRSMSFGDIGAKYKWEKAEIILDYTNIFNSRQYISTSYNDVSRYYYSYDLRPAEVLLKVRFKLK
ncbi:TonB-dependent receptor [Dysgonomonas termitidis]|uniref:TonB-dependent receptor n=1 Tax=Dysgonomonas termitidis TaxID=1516126 RepID=A0ABV9KWL5_9BACT